MKGKKSSIRKYQPKSTGVPLQWSTFQKQSSSAKLSEADTIFGKSQIIHRKSWSQIEHLWFFNALFIALNFLSFSSCCPFQETKHIYKRWCCFCVKRILAQTSTSNIFILQNHPIRSAPGTLLATTHQQVKQTLHRGHHPWPRYDWQPPLLSPSIFRWLLDCWWKTHPNTP